MGKPYRKNGAGILLGKLGQAIEKASEHGAFTKEHGGEFMRLIADFSWLLTAKLVNQFFSNFTFGSMMAYGYG